MDEENGTYTLSAYLIAQLGKNYKDGANEKITGEQLLQAAIDAIKELQYMTGEMVIIFENQSFGVPILAQFHQHLCYHETELCE